MAKTQAVWAIDVGQAALKALKLVPGEGPDQVVAEAFDYVEYPKIRSQPDADPEELVREALATFLERNDLKGCKVVLGVPGQSGLVKFIKLPPVEKKRIPDIVKFEARQQIPFALEEVIWDYQQIGGDGDDEEADEDESFTMAEVGLFAMKRDMIQREILPLTVAGIEVDAVQMGPIALCNFITFDRLRGHDAEKAAGSVVLLDIGADNTDLIITDGTRIWQRNVPIGGNHFTRALTKELKLTFAKAEHLKRNATKAPDPRAVFTAMRGVFNDFSSEVNRSIGFYSSVNRGSKIAKIIGLGNGFKLPGLQKFLQQNLTYDVEKLESFGRLVGEEVTTAPQFQENLMSFAVAYGLAVQGLGRGGLQTNLIPPEIKKARMIRRKKPWALAASALLMVGVSALFLGDWRALAKANAPDLKSAAADATTISNRGKQFVDAYEGAKGQFKTKFDEGTSLVADAGASANWAMFLKTLNDALPNPSTFIDPTTKRRLSFDNPADRQKIESLRVHVDAIIPVWREDVAAEWFDTLPEHAKNNMLAYDRLNPPTGPGWIVQVIGHHYNPRPQLSTKKEPNPLEFGPTRYLTQRVIPLLGQPKYRQFGINHVALRWQVSDEKWTSEKGLATNGLPASVPLLDRFKPAVSAEGGMSGDMSGMAAMYAGGASGMMGSGGMSGEMAGSGSGGMNPYNMMSSGMYSGMMGGGNPAAKKKDETRYLTRTDFDLQLIWQPPSEETPAPETDELVQKIREAEELAKGETRTISEADIEKASKEESLKVDQAIREAVVKAQQK
ncbi:MAG TPA: type IV pilus assembly protein PilM, partial [Isosphaeraceae bacterium]